VHQIRYGVHLLVYDLAWNIAGGLLALLGAVVAWRAWHGHRRESCTR
jgi:uncharacterized membrane protein